MMSPGQWVRVRFADGAQRVDWIPAEQPPSPDGRAGLWHVVPDAADGPSRWEWHPRADAPAPPRPRPAPDPADAVTQPLPRQVVPHRRSTAAAPSVFASSGGRGAPGRQPLVLRWAAWSLSVVLAVPVVFLLTRHSDHSGAAPTSSRTELVPSADAAPEDGPESTSPPAGEPGDASVGRYLSHLHNLDATQGYTFSSLGDESLVSVGTAACGALDGGATYEATRRSVMDQIPNGGQVVLAAAATYLCPRHHSDLQNYTAQQMGGSVDTSAG